MSTIKCGKCGAEIPAGSKFCLECGAKIEAQVEKKEKSYRPRPMHYAYGNNQSCAGKSDIIVRNGFVYFISKSDYMFEIKVSPLSDNDMVQTLYLCKGPGSTASCINMVEDELIFYEYSDGDKISAIDVYSGEKRVILEGHKAESIWIENGRLIFVENSKLFAVDINGEEYMEYDLPFGVKDRIMGYSNHLYAIAEEDGDVYEIPYDSNEFRKMNFIAGTDMIYGIIGNLYYAPAKDVHGEVIFCQNIDSLELSNGVQEVERLVTAFEQYVIFNRKNDDCSFAMNVQTLRVYRLNRYIDIEPYSFTQILSDYILIQQDGKLYKIPAPVFFQESESMFDTDKYVFVEI